jgi:hypothetical protein
MSQNISNYSFKSRATELEYMDIKRNCEPINDLEAKEAKAITTKYNMKQDNTLLKLIEWNGQYWIHQVYTTDKLEVRLINQQIKEEKFNQRVAKLLKKKLFILKRWETAKKYLDFRKKKSNAYKWKSETPEENTWREFMKEAEDREYKIEVGYNTFQELAFIDRFGFSKITKEEFAEIAEREKLINFNVNNYLKDRRWKIECAGTNNFHNTQKYIERIVRTNGTDLFYAIKKKYQVEQQMKRELKYWKNLQLIKKYNTKLHPIKELIPKEKLDE